MPWLETLTLTLGASVAKHIVKSWLGDNLSATLLGDLVDILKDEGKKVGGQNESIQQIDRIGEQISKRVFLYFKADGSKLEENQRTAIALELARTLSKAQITSKLLVDCNLDPKALSQNLVEANPAATKLFSLTETTIYNILLTETSKAIIEVATDLASFHRQFATSILQSQDQILESLTRLLSTPDEKSRRYESEYLQTVRNNLDRVEMFGVPQYDVVARKQSLTIAYISLEVNMPNAMQADGDELNLARKPVTRKNIDGERDVPEKQTIYNAPINQLLAQARRVVIRGYAGSGKTTLMRWLAVRSAWRDFPSQLSGWNNTVPFYIPLRSYVASEFPETESFVRYTARMLGGKPEDWVHQQLESGRAIVLIDGVDELPEAKRPEMLQRLNELVGAYPFARYIVTSRPHALKADLWPEWQEWITYQGFVETVLQPMNNACTEEFIDHWHSALKIVLTDEQEKEELACNPDNLKRLLRRRPTLRRLANNPLLCAMICALYRERGKSLPSERIKLYQECVEMLVSRREEHRMIGLREDYPDLNYSQQITLIQGFAYWLMHNGYSDVETDEANRYFDSRLPHLSLNNINGENICQLFVERSSLLNEPVIGRINFAHRTFQEYLAACAAVEASDFGFLLKSSLDDQWQEVIILAAGEARPKERGRFLQELISKADHLKRPKNQRRLYLLALACLETCVDLDPVIRGLVLERSACLFPPKDDDEAKRIADAGEPAVELLRIRPFLREEEAQRCVIALGMIGTDSALDALVEYAKDERFKGLEYAGIWDNFDHQIFAQKVLRHLAVLRLDELSTWDGFEYLSHITELTVRSCSLANLFPLNSFSNLRAIFLSGTHISDLSPLASLSNLGTLSLNGSHISDLSPLASLSNLTDIYLNDSQISDFSPLVSLPQLSRVILDGSQVNDRLPAAFLAKVKAFQICGGRVSDFSPLLAMLNLISLYLIDTQIPNFSTLVFLPELRELFLDNIQVSEISSLASLASLRHLYLDTKVSDISFLTSLSELRKLSLHGPHFFDFTTLASLPNLRELRLNKSQISDLSHLVALSNLQELHIDSEKACDLSALSALLDLQNLYVNCSQNIDLSSLSSLASLKKLFLRGSRVADLSPLTSLSNLTFLALGDLLVSDFSPIASLPNLSRMSLGSAKGVDLSPLKSIKSLTLELRPSQFHNFMTELIRFPNLVGLDLSYNNLTTLEPLLHFPQLSKLDLSGNWIIDFSPLAKLYQLEELDLSDTYIREVKTLSTLVELKELDISYTSVTDITPLADLPNLRKLTIEYCPIHDLSTLANKPGLEIIR
jgi:Leucine-rich repeat (LRR) protein